ncbi:MAG: AbrB/MazE/SpoVT family DNA-binding domain-containing protein [Candidatus Dormibacteraceae bacterium]
MTVTTVNPKGQVTIPEEIRARYGFAAGTKVAWIERDGHAIPVALIGHRSLRGRLTPSLGATSLQAILAAERRADRAREDA